MKTSDKEFELKAKLGLGKFYYKMADYFKYWLPVEVYDKAIDAIYNETFKNEEVKESRRPRGRMLREYREDNYTHCFKIWKDGDISGIRLFKGTISDIAFYFRLGFHPYDMHELLSALHKKGVNAYEIHDSQYYSNKDHLERVDLS